MVGLTVKPAPSLYQLRRLLNQRVRHLDAEGLPGEFLLCELLRFYPPYQRIQ